MPNIYFDGSSLLRNPDGVGRYTTEIYKRLSEPTIITYSDTDDFGYQVERLPFPRKIYYALYKKLWRVPVDSFLKTKPDVIIYPNFVRAPLVKNTKSIAVIHDLAYLHTPEYVSDKNRKYLAKFVPQSINDADLVIAVSQTTKKDIIQEYSAPDSKVLVASNAVNPEDFYADEESIKSVKKKYELDGDYFLFVSTIEPRKNITGLLAAYEKLSKESPILVLAGGDGWKNEEIHSKVSQLRNRGFKIVMTGFVDTRDLPALYKGASLFVLPSHFEGFGIPILEAQASGVPVITSNRAPMNEVAGDAALLVNPDDPSDIADKISLLYGDSDLQKELVEKGYKNIKRFTWDKSAKVFKDAIERLTK